MLGSQLVASCSQAPSPEAAAALLPGLSTEPALVIVSDSFLGDLPALELLRARCPSARFLLLSPLGRPALQLPDLFQGTLARPPRPERLQRSLQALQGGSAEAPRPASAPERHARILVVEDNPVNRKVIARMLDKLGHSYLLAETGEESLEILSRESFDLALMDMRLPGIDGPEVTRELRRREGDERHLVVVAVTANAFAEDRARCLESGMDDFLPKPVRMEDLDAMLVRWLRRGPRDGPISVR